MIVKLLIIHSFTFFLRMYNYWRIYVYIDTYVLHWPKSLFQFLHNILQKIPNELSGYPNICFLFFWKVYTHTYQYIHIHIYMQSISIFHWISISQPVHVNVGSCETQSQMCMSYPPCQGGLRWKPPAPFHQFWDPFRQF